jgi:hypothetical protein
MGEIVAPLRAARETASDEHLDRISPLAYTHIIPNGTDVFDGSQQRGNFVLTALPSEFLDPQRPLP